MPIQHIVLLKFKPEVTQAEIDHIIANGHRVVREKAVPGYLSFSGGPYDGSEGMNKGFTHAITVVFADAESRDGYQPHPEHETIKQYLIPRLEDILAFDYVL